MPPKPKPVQQAVQREILTKGRPASLAWLLIVACLTLGMHNATLIATGQYGQGGLGVVNTPWKTWLVMVAFVGLVGGLIWLLPRLIGQPFCQWGVMVCQLALTVGVGTWLHGGQELLYMGMLPLMLIEGLNLVSNKWWVLALIWLTYGAVWVSYGLNTSWMRMAIMIQASLFTAFIVIYYWRFYSRQVDERMKSEKVLAELQLAYKQLEASTARNERERMARELHDTLTQGLAGVVMQLEAADNLLDNDQVTRAKPIIKRSVTIARKTLQNSRLTLTDLRSASEGDLLGRLQLLTETFQKNYGLTVQTKLPDLPQFTPDVLTEVSRCISEALTNVVKHAQTDTVIIRGQRQAASYQVQVVDFGQGFKATMRQPAGHFGLVGLQERMTAIGGQLQLTSEPGEGTTVTFLIPIKVGDKHD
ncbi:sensor histidine kinase [Lactiplantibacillus daowaiensis]|uniref:histidine kinase n=1 Tax=Lactiplantibacillus daowaiensis TaxID=2559918 RepID=A0ABW1S5A2_9LACO|nr:sensor histidine kinase [Lactiplantibacillus daowaiensis]